MDCNIKIYFHNNTGCAVTNTYIIFKARATYINTTVLSIGKRDNITPLSGLIVFLTPIDSKYILSKYKIEKLSYFKHLVAQIIKVKIVFNNFVVSLQKFN